MRNSRLPVNLVLVACLIAVPHATAGDALRLEGVLSRKQPNSDAPDLANGRVTTAETYGFTVLVELPVVQIILKDLGRDSDVDSIEYLSDGDTCYVSIIPRPLTGQREILVPIPGTRELKRVAAEGYKRRSDAIMTINSSPVPDFHPGLTPVWLAYGAGTYYRGNGDRPAGAAFPVGENYGVGVQLQHTGVEVGTSWETHDAKPYFLTHFVEFQPKRFFYRRGDDILTRKWPARYKSNLTNAVYEVRSWTNLMGVEVPESFVAIKYLPDVEFASLGGVVPNSRMEGILVKAERVATNLPTMPSIAAKTRVIENRLERDGRYSMAGIVYDTTNSTLLGLDEVRQLPEYQRRLAGISRKLSPLLRMTMYLVFSCVLALPLAAWLKRRQKTN